MFVIEAVFKRRTGLPEGSKQWRDFCSKSCYCEYESHGRTPWRSICPTCYGPKVSQQREEKR